MNLDTKKVSFETNLIISRANSKELLSTSIFCTTQQIFCFVTTQCVRLVMPAPDMMNISCITPFLIYKLHYIGMCQSNILGTDARLTP